MMESHGCAVPFLKSTKPVCTDLGAIQDTFWIAYNRVTNQARRLLRKDFFSKKNCTCQKYASFYCVEMMSHSSSATASPPARRWWSPSAGATPASPARRSPGGASSSTFHRRWCATTRSTSTPSCRWWWRLAAMSVSCSGSLPSTSSGMSTECSPGRRRRSGGGEGSRKKKWSSSEQTFPC